MKLVVIIFIQSEVNQAQNTITVCFLLFEEMKSCMSVYVCNA